MRRAPDPLDATLGRGGDLLEGVAGQVGQLHYLEASPQALHRIQLGGVARQRLHHQPGPLATQPGTHHPATVGGQPIPQQGRLLPAKEAAQLAERLDEVSVS
jgi:hypothetical protein